MEPITAQEVSLSDHLFGWWYRIAAPPEVPDEAPLRDRMRVRSGKLTSVIFLIQIIFFLSTLIVVLLSAPSVAPILVITIGVMWLGVFLNRIGKTITAGILVIIVLEVGLTVNILTHPGGLSPLLMTLFNFFVAPELVAASLIVPWAALPVTLMNCLITIALITYAPKTPEMVQVLRAGSYSTYANAIQIQVMVAVVVFLWVSSTYKEMKRANTAEEVNKLTIEMTIQQQAMQQEKQRLEESIQQIVSVHMQVANGNLNARVPLDQQNVLWTIAGSLNNLLARLQSWRQDATQLRQNEQALQQLLYNIQIARRQEKPLQVYTTGTSLDALIQEISKGMTVPQPHNQSISVRQPPDSWF